MDDRSNDSAACAKKVFASSRFGLERHRRFRLRARKINTNNNERIVSQLLHSRQYYGRRARSANFKSNASPMVEAAVYTTKAASLSEYFEAPFEYLFPIFFQAFRDLSFESLSFPRLLMPFPIDSYRSRPVAPFEPPSTPSVAL